MVPLLGIFSNTFDTYIYGLCLLWIILDTFVPSCWPLTFVGFIWDVIIINNYYCLLELPLEIFKIFLNTSFCGLCFGWDVQLWYFWILLDPYFCGICSPGTFCTCTHHCLHHPPQDPPSWVWGLRWYWWPAWNQQRQSNQLYFLTT